MNVNDRFDQVMKVCNDELITTPEKLKFVYHWMNFEFALIKRDVQQHRADRHATWLKNHADIFNFRHELQDQ